MTEMMRELCAHELHDVSGCDGAVGASLGAAIAGAAAALVQSATTVLQFGNEIVPTNPTFFSPFVKPFSPLTAPRTPRHHVCKLLGPPNRG
jgi:hypothetical protein